MSSVRLGVLLAGWSLPLLGCGGGIPIKSSSEPAQALVAGKADAAPAKITEQERKIIYTGSLDVVVGDLDKAIAETETFLGQQKAFVAKSDIRTDAGSRRTATYTLRVPAENFKSLTKELATLGVPERNTSDSQDVTEEYVDVQAQLRNLKTEENWFLDFMGKSTSRDETRSIRKDIEPIRERIDRTEARLQKLSSLTSLSTLNLALREIKNYTPSSAPTYNSRVSAAFNTSWNNLVEFLSGASILAVAAVPWLPVVIPLGAACYIFGGRARRRITTSGPIRAQSTAHRPSPQEEAEDLRFEKQNELDV